MRASETAGRTSKTSSADPADDATVIVRDVSVQYRVYEDSGTPTLKRLVARQFRGRRPRVVNAVKNVSFDIYKGEAVGLIGRNGSGKSSLLRAVAGLMPTNGGRIYARSDPVLLGVGAALHPELSGRRNVFLGGTALGLTRGAVEDRFDDIVDLAGVRNFIDMPLRAYSSGMAARLRFAIASSVQPDILLIDEALAVGDTEFQAKSEDRIRDLLADAGTVVFVSHSLKNVSDICTRGLWLDDGVLRQDGPVDEVIKAYQAEVRERPRDAM